MQQQINIPYYSANTDQIDGFLETINPNFKNSIGYNPWKYEFSGEACFIIGYTDAGILLKFDVIEENVVAKFTKANDPVYKDSCVEFFIALDGEDSYYNFEFNAKGTCLAGYGSSATNRNLLTVEKIKQIEVTSRFKSIIFKEKEMINWQLTMLIPNEVFQYHQIENFNQHQAKMNFYKCGDDLPKPHYLCWSPIINVAEPDFHVPNQFGKAVFLKN